MKTASLQKTTVQKTTDELAHEIKTATDIEDYLARNQEHLFSDGNLSRHLNMLLKQKHLSRADVVRGSLLDRAYVYQIFSGEKSPSRDKLIALAFGLRLSDEETQKMLKLSCSRELYAREERDALILFALQHGMTIMSANDLLFKHNFPVLGCPKE